MEWRERIGIDRAVCHDPAQQQRPVHLGTVDQAAMHELVGAIEAALAAMGVTDCRPAVRPEAAA
jgi:hypothetical protein